MKSFLSAYWSPIAFAMVLTFAAGAAYLQLNQNTSAIEDHSAKIQALTLSSAQQTEAIEHLTKAVEKLGTKTIANQK